MYESAGVQPRVPESTGRNRLREGPRVLFAQGEIRILDSNGAVERTIPFNETHRRL